VSDAGFIADKEARIAEILERGYAWLDTDTPGRMLDAADFVRALEKRQGFKIASPEEIAFHKGLIDVASLERAIAKFGKSDYGRYLNRLFVLKDILAVRVQMVAVQLRRLSTVDLPHRHGITRS
jgi:dTDP-glucose pyrophosphorylase